MSPAAHFTSIDKQEEKDMTVEIAKLMKNDLQHYASFATWWSYRFLQMTKICSMISNLIVCYLHNYNCNLQLLLQYTELRTISLLTLSGLLCALSIFNPALVLIGLTFHKNDPGQIALLTSWWAQNFWPGHQGRHCPADKLSTSLPYADAIALFACTPDQCTVMTSSMWQSLRAAESQNCLRQSMGRGAPLSWSNLPLIAPVLIFFLSPGTSLCLWAALTPKSSEFSVGEAPQAASLSAANQEKWPASSTQWTGCADLGGGECRSVKGQSIGSRKGCEENPRVGKVRMFYRRERRKWCDFVWYRGSIKIKMFLRH